jgi:nucleotide-binding universal stress UspA family protein
MRLLVPVDGSPEAQEAVRHAIRLAKAGPNSAIVLLNVQNHETLGFSDIRGEIDTKNIAAAESAKILRGPMSDCEAAGVICETCAEFGPICDTIVEVAKDTAADQIVMGTRGLGHLGTLFLGSIATGVIHMADIPVTLVKRGSGA